MVWFRFRFWFEDFRDLGRRGRVRFYLFLYIFLFMFCVVFSIEKVLSEVIEWRKGEFIRDGFLD